MLSKFPAAVVVTLYRPFIWESRKVIILFSAMESMIFLYLTLLVFYRNGIKTFRKIFSDPTLFFCLVLTLIFAFAVGISSYNFGALSRYKIPCMPFFGAFLVILLYKGREHVLEKKIAIRKKRKMLQPL
jgi:ABC-type sulfate transport system permease component